MLLGFVWFFFYWCLCLPQIVKAYCFCLTLLEIQWYSLTRAVLIFLQWLIKLWRLAWAGYSWAIDVCNFNLVETVTWIVLRWYLFYHWSCVGWLVQVWPSTNSEGGVWGSNRIWTETVLKALNLFSLFLAALERTGELLDYWSPNGFSWGKFWIPASTWPFSKLIKTGVVVWSIF